ncbi:MAG: hypothetical protein PHQ90_03480 [Sulfuricurvum sp.]|uniref:hypothetical protein n=1 Tax=Sulfuricurvum sp. TaxID=2025608 RepID=UPI00261A1138|nr:hypothetical protein [Sulfuricurvum sp.]MDD2368338.1 hypothetical protein [Sulfuricurvum sp.]MDD5117786.1 hypothetical protein [Sulfuricurvum sp.]
MEENTELKRPWTIKWAVGLLSFVFITGLIEGVLNHNVNSALLAQIAFILVLLFGIWRGNRWGRNLLFLSLLFILPLAVLLFGLMIQIPSKWDLGYAIGVFRTLLSIVATVFLFMKLSNEWFASMKGESFQEDLKQLSWNFQLTLIVISIGLSALVIDINNRLDLFTFMGDVIRNVLDYNERQAMLVGIDAFGFLIGAIIVLFPFGILLGYWKEGNAMLLTRLITIGSIFPMIVFSIDKTHLLFSIYLMLSQVMIVGVVVYFGLRFGMGTARYFDTLRVPIEIK